MSLIDLQRDIQSVCLADEPDASALNRLGNERIFLIYRDMVRKRLYGELKVALKRTYAAAGDEVFSAVFSKFMMQKPPRCRFFHDLPVEFSAMAEQEFRDRHAVPEYVVDLLLYEAARWQVSDLPGPDEGAAELVEFDFDLPTVLHSAVRLLALQHPVHTKAPAGGAYARKATYLVVYRPTDADRVHSLRIAAHTHAVVQHLQREGGNMSDAIKRVSQLRGIVIDQTFLNALCGELAILVDKRILLGARSPALD